MTAVRLRQALPVAAPVPMAVDVVAAGRRNNPPEAGVPALCAFSPLHFLELPELLIELISSMTGKSPSTTGAFLSYALTGYDGWISGAGHVGPSVKVAHDVSLLIPEVFARMTPQERSADGLIRAGHLEQVQDIEVDGRVVPARRLGYRITESFARTFLGRIFMHPDAIFTEAMLRPESQDLRALMEIMADGISSEGHTLNSPDFRALFTRDSVLASDWYAARLDAAQAQEVARAEDGVTRLETFLADRVSAEPARRTLLESRRAEAHATVANAASAAFRESLIGTLGRQATFR